MKFYNKEYYHIYNRGIDKRRIFLNKDDYIRFLMSVRFFNQEEPIGSIYQFRKRTRKKTMIRKTFNVFEDVECLSDKCLVNLIAYCLNPNHFHLVLKQIAEGGISEFMKRIGDGYTKYFNYRHERSGSLFGSRFKSTHIDSNEYLLWIVSYVNGNSEIHGMEKAENYIWSSYLDYTGERNGVLCKKEIILDQFSNNSAEYKKFTEMVTNCIKEKREFQKYLLE